MNELLSKVSSYNVFNYLFPGIVFAVLAEKVIPYSVGQHDVIAMAFLYYFVGLVISRFGSLIIEPFLKQLRFVKFADYRDFVSSARSDSQIETLSEVNNTYRTLTAAFFLLLLLKGAAVIEGRYPAIRPWNVAACAFLLLLLFVFSYRKQTTYIVKRISFCNSSKA